MLTKLLALLTAIVLPILAVEAAAKYRQHQMVPVVVDREPRDYVTDRKTGVVLVCSCPAVACDPWCPVHGGGQ